MTNHSKLLPLGADMKAAINRSTFQGLNMLGVTVDPTRPFSAPYIWGVKDGQLFYSRWFQQSQSFGWSGYDIPISNIFSDTKLETKIEDLESDNQDLESDLEEARDEITYLKAKLSKVSSFLDKHILGDRSLVAKIEDIGQIPLNNLMPHHVWQAQSLALQEVQKIISK